MRYLLFAVLSASLGCGSAETGAVKIDPALAGLVPPDAVLLLGVRMDALRATPLYQKWIAGKPAPALDQLSQETGLDLRRDLWEMLLVSDGVHTAVLARGKFSGADGLEPRLQKQGARRTTYKGYTLIGNEEGVVTFMNASTAVAGSPAAVRAIIDQRSRSSGPPQPMRDRIASIPAGSQLWLAATGGVSQLERDVPQAGNMANLGKILAMIESATGAADARSGLKAFVSGTCRTEQDAKSLGDAVRGLIGLGRLSTPENQPEMLRVYDGMQVEQQQRTVRLNIGLSPQLLDTLMSSLAALSTGPRSPRLQRRP